MDILALVIAALACILLLVSAIAFLRTKDVFTMLHVVIAVNLYVLPLVLLAIELKNFSLISAIKIAALVVINIVIVNLISAAAVQKAISNKIDPDVSN